MLFILFLFLETRTRGYGMEYWNAIGLGQEGVGYRALDGCKE